MKAHIAAANPVLAKKELLRMVFPVLASATTMLCVAVVLAVFDHLTK